VSAAVGGAFIGLMLAAAYGLKIAEIKYIVEYVWKKLGWKPEKSAG